MSTRCDLLPTKKFEIWTSVFVTGEHRVLSQAHEVVRSGYDVLSNAIGKTVLISIADHILEWLWNGTTAMGGLSGSALSLLVASLYLTLRPVLAA